MNILFRAMRYNCAAYCNQLTDAILDVMIETDNKDKLINIWNGVSQQVCW